MALSQVFSNSMFQRNQIAASLSHSHLVSTRKLLRQATSLNIEIVNIMRVRALAGSDKSETQEMVLRTSLTSLLEGMKQVRLRELLHPILRPRSGQDSMK